MDKQQDFIQNLKDEYPDIYDGVAAMTEKAIETSRQVISDTLKKQEFDKTLKEAYPNWENTLQTPGFKQFLGEIHELSGVPNWVFIKDAFDKLDSKRVIEIFDIFSKWKPSLRNRTLPSMSVAEAKRQYEKLIEDKIRKRFRGTEADFKKREAELVKIILGR
jgi:hypothetical protein